MTQDRFLIENLLRIPDKDGNDVDFILNADQAAFDEAATGRDIIAKYRQGGFSTYPLGRALVRCLAYRNRRHVIIAHNTDTTQKLLGRIHYMVKHFKGPQPDIKYATQNRIVFGKNDSSIFIGTAGSDDYGVGDTITDLHCSEVSRWPNPEALLSGLFQAVPPSGNILLESTGRGTGNWFHKACMRAQRGGSYKLHFYNWLNTPEYSKPLTDEQARQLMGDLDAQLEEPQLLARGLTLGQIAWRRMKLEESNYDLRGFKENYPLTLTECFQATGFGVFHEINFVERAEWHSIDPWTFVLGDQPIRRVGYVLGVDVAGGGGGDFSVVEGLEAETGEHVLEYRNNMIEPDRFARRVYDLGKKFNNAYLVIERNNHGPVVIKELLNLGYPGGRIHQSRTRGNAAKGNNDLGDLMNYGIYTTDTMKALMIGELQKNVRDEVCIHSEILHLEMGSFIENDNGKMEATAGCFDDCVMALAFANYGRPRAARMFAREREEEDRGRGLRMNEVFEAGRAINELEARWNNANAALPVGTHVDGLGDWL